MTLVLGVVSREGVVLVSDSQVTYDTTGQPVRAVQDKIFAPWTNVAWGASTNRGGVVQHVRDHLAIAFQHRNRFENKSRPQVRTEIVTEVSKKYREVLDRTIQIPGMKPIQSSFLFVGVARDGLFILEIHPDLTDTDHTAQGYAAVGSGDIFPYYALASLQHFNVRERSLYEAKLLAHRIMQDAINIAAFGLGPPIQMIEIAIPAAGQAPNGRVLHVDEVRTLGDKVTEWKELESEDLTRFVGLRPAPVLAETVPVAPPPPEDHQ